MKDIFISNGMNILKSDKFATCFVIFADTEETYSLENTTAKIIFIQMIKCANLCNGIQRDLEQLLADWGAFKRHTLCNYQNFLNQLQ